MKSVVIVTLCCICILAANGQINPEKTAIDLLRNIYKECLKEGSFSCVRPKVLAFLSHSMSKEKIKITRDLTIVRINSNHGEHEPDNSTADFEKKLANPKLLALDKLDRFAHEHELRVRVPKEIVAGELPPYVPDILRTNLPEEIRLPLVGSDDKFSGRSKKFLKRIVMPFLLGLKFKATTLIPLAFALIALKTWKALTLALLSIVLSGAMVLFKFSKQKTNYEVIHYPHPQPVPVYDHHHDPHHHHHEHHVDYHRRSADPQQMAYSAQI